MNIFWQYVFAFCSSYEWYHDGGGLSYWINGKSYPVDWKRKL